MKDDIDTEIQDCRYTTAQSRSHNYLDLTVRDRSLLGLLLGVLGLLGLLLLVLLLGLGHVDVFESLELLDQEGSLDSVDDVSAGEDATISSADGSLGGGEPLESAWSSDLNTLHASALGVLSDVVEHNSTACGRMSGRSRTYLGF